MHTEAISYDVRGVTYVGYLAAPEGSDLPRPGVLVGHEGSGLGPQVKERCHQLAELGYVAFAVDYIGGGRVLPDMATTMARLGQLRADLPLVRELGRAGLDILRRQRGVDGTRLAAIGYCFGGTFALELARDGAELACVVVFHAGLATSRPDDARNIKGKILACAGADDPLVSPEERLAFEREMRAANVDWRLEVYGHALHGFTNPYAAAAGNPAVAYHGPSHRRSWRAMLDLFDETFAAHKPPGGRTVVARIVTPHVAALAQFVIHVFGATGELPADRPAALRIGDSIVMISDGGGARTPQPGFLYVYVEDVDATCSRALAAGAQLVEPPADQPYGDRRATVRDAWANTWQIARTQLRPG